MVRAITARGRVFAAGAVLGGARVSYKVLKNAYLFG